MKTEPRSITLVLPYPISANRYWATRVITPRSTGKPMAMTYITGEAKWYRDQVAKAASVAGITEKLQGRVELEVKLYPQRPLDWRARQRKHGPNWDDTVRCIDLGNAEKVLSDALKDVIMDDDKWFWKISLERMEPDNDYARMIVTVTEIPTITTQAAIFGEMA